MELRRLWRWLDTGCFGGYSSGIWYEVAQWWQAGHRNIVAIHTGLGPFACFVFLNKLESYILEYSLITVWYKSETIHLLALPVFCTLELLTPCLCMTFDDWNELQLVSDNHS